MKNLLFLVFPFLLAVNANAQSATFTTTSGANDTVMMQYTNLGQTLDVHNDIASNGGPVTLKWKVTYLNMGSGWDATSSGICDNSDCYSNLNNLYNNGNGLVNRSEPYTALSTFKVQFYPGNVPFGSRATVTVNLLDSVSGYSRNLTFVVYRGALGVNQVASNNNVTVFPNPARESVNVIFDRQADVKTIAIYNMIGKTMRIFKATDNSSARLDLDAIPSGVYFLRLMNSDGQIVATRRFTRQ